MGAKVHLLVSGAVLLHLALMATGHVIEHGDSGLHAKDGSPLVDFSLGVIKPKCNQEKTECSYEADNDRKITIRDLDDRCKVVMHSAKADASTQDCYPIGNLHWFGGAEQKHQYWPLENFESLSHATVPVELESRAIADPLWYNSKGLLVYAEKGAPLFYEQNTVKKGSICLVGKLEKPFRARTALEFSYYVCQLKNAKEAFQYAITNFISKPSAYPDEKMITYPIWSTWARFKTVVNDSAVRQFANDITANGFRNSHLEIDDRWETCYGSVTFDKSRFPDMKGLSNYLHSKDFTVTLWTHFFIQLDCEETLNEAKEKGYLVKDLNGNPDSTWWNGKAAVVDFTKEDAKKWWVDRHRKMLTDNGIDGLKFDAGETSWPPQLPDLNVPQSPKENYPGQFTEDYVRACAGFGGKSEFRSAHHTQDLPIFIRMIDKDSRWGYDNGLKTLVTTLLQMNSVGYPMVLPDMIGGNGYEGDQVTKELFIRWIQANAFMPALQYSFVPWDYDQETITVAKKFNALHEKYSPNIINAMKKAVSDGTPVNPPIWWLDPENEDALKENSEFLVGEEILVAPVLDENALTRDVYLPTGTWKDGNTDKIYEGPTLLKSYPAPLDTLPYFLLVASGTTTTAPSTSTEIHTTIQPNPTSTPTSTPASASPTMVISNALLMILMVILLRQ